MDILTRSCAYCGSGLPEKAEDVPSNCTQCGGPTGIHKAKDEKKYKPMLRISSTNQMLGTRFVCEYQDGSRKEVFISGNEILEHHLVSVFPTREHPGLGNWIAQKLISEFDLDPDILSKLVPMPDRMYFGATVMELRF